MWSNIINAAHHLIRSEKHNLFHHFSKLCTFFIFLNVKILFDAKRLQVFHVLIQCLFRNFNIEYLRLLHFPRIKVVSKASKSIEVAVPGKGWCPIRPILTILLGRQVSCLDHWIILLIDFLVNIFVLSILWCRHLFYFLLLLLDDQGNHCVHEVSLVDFVIEEQLQIVFVCDCLRFFRSEFTVNYGFNIGLFDFVSVDIAPLVSLLSLRVFCIQDFFKACFSNVVLIFWLLH